MKFQEILVILSTVCVLITAENKDARHQQNDLHEKSHHSKIQQEKRQNHYHILNRNKQSISEHQRSSRFRNFIYRDGNGKCSWVCPDENGKPSSNSLGLQADYKGNAGLVGVVNKTSNIALFFDGHNNVAALINGQSGVIIVIDINSKSIYRISNTQAVDLKSGFDAYFQNLPSLQTLLNTGQQSSEKYNFSSINPSILGDLSSLGLSRSSSSEDLNQIALFTSELKRSLAPLYENSGSFNISKNIEWFLNLNLEFAKLLDNNEETLQSLHIQLDSVFGASSGIEALLNLLSQIGKHVDLSKLLFKYLTSPEDLLCLLLDVSRGSNDGIDGLETVLAEIIDVIHGKGSVVDVIHSVLTYNPESQGISSNLSQIISETLDIIRSQNSTFQNFPAFEGLFHILTALNNNNLVWNHLNISDLIKLLQFKSPGEIIQTITKIITEYASSHGIPQFINFIKDIPDYGRILQTAFEGNISQMLLNSNVTALLSNHPVLGHFIRQITTYLGNGADIGHYLNSSSILKTLNEIIEGNSTHGPIGNIIGTFTNGASGIEHGISGILGAVLGSNSTHGPIGNIIGTFTNGASGFEHGISGILEAVSGFLGDNSTHGPIGNIINTFTNGASGIEHGISGILGSIGGFLGSGSEHDRTSESPSESSTTSSRGSTSTGGLQLNNPSSGISIPFLGHDASSESPSGNPTTSGSVSTFTGAGGLQLNGSSSGFALPFLGHDNSSESSPSGTPITSESVSTVSGTGGLQLNGSSSVHGQISSRKTLHGKHNLHEKKENKLHHKFHERKRQHEH